VALQKQKKPPTGFGHLEFQAQMEKLGVKYFRYMDDILILAPTRWKLRKAIRLLNQIFSELKMEKHPDKTLIGKVERGFYFLGYFLKPDSLTVPEKTFDRFIESIVQLYEQETLNRREGRLG
jgi:RNA-directed DNA polymerase